MKFLDEINSLAAAHETNGGTCEMITVNAKDINNTPVATVVKCCLDANGKVQGDTMRVLAFLHR